MGPMYGKIPVAYATAWSAEEKMWIAPCPYADGHPAIHQESRPGEGKPTFAKPHMNRQREAIFKGLCDICGCPMRNRTKVSMSEERVVNVQGAFLPLVVEPLCCKTCAGVAVRHCPHLKRRIAEKAIIVRQVFKYRVVLSQLTGEATLEFAGECRPGAIGHLKMQLTKFHERSLDWILKGAA